VFERGNRSRFFTREFASLYFRLPLASHNCTCTVARTMKFSGVTELFI